MADDREYVVGIDPGKTGAVSFIDIQNPYSKSFTLNRGKGKKDLTLGDIAEVLGEYMFNIKMVGIERVNIRGQQRGMSIFMKEAGIYIGILMTLKLPFREIVPAVWQRRLNCLTKGDKNITKGVAQGMFTSISITHTNADALLIGEYVRRYLLP